MELLLATRNQHKIHEIRTLIEPISKLQLVGLEDVGLNYEEREEELEPYDTFEENALSKAEYFHELSEMPVIADDSGLVVDCLNGAPGVKSKRFSPFSAEDGISRDEANNKHLIHCLSNLPDTEWQARYVCVATFLFDNKGAKFSKGEVKGRIIKSARGTEGFGYDPHFLPDESNFTFGQMSEDEKNLISHRGRAFKNLFQVISHGV